MNQLLEITFVRSNGNGRLKKLREIARKHIEKAAAGDMQAIKELADRLDGKPGQILEHNQADSEPITKIVREIVHTWPSPEELHSDSPRARMPVMDS
jgi:hypothetical protein